MKQLVTQAIVLGRTDYGEADRILTLLTPQQGKLRLMAKGVRRVKSKLAGGIELFSISSVTYVSGRGEIGTLVSTRLHKYYSHIVKDLDRTMLGYELIKELNKITEDEPESAYFELLEAAFVALDDRAIALELIRFWFSAQLLRLGGHAPNLQTDTAGQKLLPDKTYGFDFDHMAFTLTDDGQFDANHIKLLRLCLSGSSPTLLASIRGGERLLVDCSCLIENLRRAV